MKSPTCAGEACSGEVTLVLTSCGRQDLLEITLDSFLRYNTFPIHQFIVIEDGDGENNLTLANKYSKYPFKWLATGTRVGQVAAIDLAYQEVSTDLIFHCEDDWEFTVPGFIEKSSVILQHNDEVLLVGIRALDDVQGHPILPGVLAAKNVPYRLLCHHYDAGKWGVWHGFTWNPVLWRRRDYNLLGTFASLDPDRNKLAWEVERDASAFYQHRGFFAAILADNDGRGYVRHLGGDRHVNEPIAGRVV
jgi:Glycosyl transferase family 2